MFLLIIKMDYLIHMQTILHFIEGLVIYKPGLDYGKNGGDQLVIIASFLMIMLLSVRTYL